MRYYPIALDTKDKSILVVGGGRAAYIKLKNLVNTCASITAISQSFCEDVVKLKDSHPDRLVLEEKTIQKEKIDLEDDYFMVFLCTEDKDLNLELFKFYKEKRILAMMANNVEKSDFINSAVLEKENITVAINTGGRSPTASTMLLEKIEEVLTDELIEKIDIICKIRKKLKDQACKNNKEGFYEEIKSITSYSNHELKEKLKQLG